MIMIANFCLILLFVGDPILLCRFKMGDEVFDLLGMGAIFIGHVVDGHFILDHSH